jgi:hypothetical protein
LLFQLISIDDRKYKKELKLSLGVQLDDSCNTPKAFYHFGEDDIPKIYKQEEQPEIPLDPKMANDERELTNVLRRHLFNHPNSSIKISEIRTGVKTHKIFPPQKQDQSRIKSRSSLGFVRSSSAQKKRASPPTQRPKTVMAITPLLRSSPHISNNGSSSRTPKLESPHVALRPASALSRKSNNSKSPIRRLKKLNLDLQAKFRIANTQP